jgi:GntR family transcriptional regulator, transcriptional repressor for pyruvate dehydrogenase complex
MAAKSRTARRSSDAASPAQAATPLATAKAPDPVPLRMGSAVSRVSVTRQVVDILYEALHSGRYRPGDRLPSEHELAASLGVGRSALREAIRELLTLDLLEIRAGRGTFVRPMRPELLLDRSSFHGVLNQRIAVELLEVRFAIEPEAAVLAARRATQDDVQRLKRDVEQLRLGIARGLRPPEDAGFHIDVVRATHNSSLLRLSTAIMDFYEHDDAAPTPEDLADHKAVCDAIEQGDEDEARERMRQHLVTVSSRSAWHARSDKNTQAGKPETARRNGEDEAR